MIAPPCVPRPASSPPPDEWRAFVCRPSGRLTSAKHTSATAAQGIYCKFQQFATTAVVSVLRFAADADLLWPMAALLFAIGQVFTVASRSWLFHFVTRATPAFWQLPAGKASVLCIFACSRSHSAALRFTSSVYASDHPCPKNGETTQELIGTLPPDLLPPL